MATSINSVLSIGTGALFASQTAIQTTGNNIANVNTAGYSRQAVRFESMPSLDYFPGQMGQGVLAKEVYRHFDQFIEREYLDKNSDTARWSAQYSQLKNVESLFNEANSDGIGSALNSFFSAWNKLAQTPSAQSTREDVLNKSQTLVSTLRNASMTLTDIEQRVNDQLTGQVDQVNKLIEEISYLNREINAHTVTGKNNANTMLDQRDQKVRELSELIDVDVINKGAGDYIVNTKSGYTLVDGLEAFKVSLEGPRAFSNLSAGSAFDGGIGFDGADGYEYTVEIVQGGGISATQAEGVGEARYKVSLDGGRTWLSDDLGNPVLYSAHTSEYQTYVKDLGIYFNPGTQNLQTGDRFTIVPKSAVYWIEPTIGPINISPQVFPDGTTNYQRITGGAIGGNLIFRDYQAEQFRDQLDSLTQSIIWEVNRLHSQGSGLEKLTYALGDHRVSRTNVPLGGSLSSLPWAGDLQAGNFSFAFYDKVTGEPISSTTDNAFSVNFNPATDSLQDVVNRINAAAGGKVTASIVDNRLQLAAGTDGAGNALSFGVVDDTTGLLAGLGINNFFKGTDSGDIAIRDELVQNRNLINAGRVNGGLEGNVGDNITAKAIADLSTVKVSIDSVFKKATEQTISAYYGTLISNVGGETSSASFNQQLYGTMARDLDDRQSEVAGVNLDEEMSNLIKFQASYKAAAKLITTADQMLQTLLSLKQ